MTDAPTSAGPPPGWYADSPHAARVRWWNGSAWTDHYQAATDASAIVAPADVPMADPEPLPTRTARRAAAPAAPQTGPPQNTWLAASALEPFPDQILGRAPRMGEYRPPPRPVVYQPQAVNYAAPAPSTFIPVTSENGPAAASLVFSAIGLAAGVVAYVWISPARPTLGGLINLLIIAAFLCAVGLAVVGLVLAAQRPTRKGRSVLALVVSVLLLGGTLGLFALRMVPVGALYSGG